MLRRFLDYQLSLAEPGKPLHRVRPLIQALDTFLYEPLANTKTAPYIRDSVDIKRWMILVVIALLPAIFMAIWNTGLQSLVYSSGNATLMHEYLEASTSFSGYFNFVSGRVGSILLEGAKIFLPVVAISYAVGGACEALFACVRRHEINEGFLVTGILYPLILPPTIPYWMVAVGVAAGVVLGKEIFGGTGMNIMNPALMCRAFLFFAYPSRMSGTVWAGSSIPEVKQSLNQMNAEGSLFTQATPLARLNISHEIKRAHVDAIATNNLGDQVGTFDVIQKQFDQWSHLPGHEGAELGKLSAEQLNHFVTAPASSGGLGLSLGAYDDAVRFSSLRYGMGADNDGSFFFGNRLGSMGETSVLACMLGAAFLIYTGIASWRTMLGMVIGAFLTASCLEYGAHFLGADGGAWNAAQFDIPAYKHLLLGGFAFGAVFMATDPVSSPTMELGKWVYGLLIGMVAIIIRAINPAYPEGVMLAILFGNVCAPLIDNYAVQFYRRKRSRVPVTQ